jgi:hypothetical protein
MKEPMAIEQFIAWSAGWKNERKRKGTDPAKILALWQQPTPRGWEREIWKGRLGYRKRTDDKGERCIEKELFDGRPKVLIFPDEETNSEYRVESIYHNMPLANQRGGQVIADALCVLKIDKCARPLLIEVKDEANDPWFALVENLQQIRLARACAHKIQEFLHENWKHPVQRGVWGLILAPESYYKRHSACLTKCRALLDALRTSSRARVAFGHSDLLADDKIKIVAHNWPTMRSG